MHLNIERTGTFFGGMEIDIAQMPALKSVDFVKSFILLMGAWFFADSAVRAQGIPPPNPVQVIDENSVDLLTGNGSLQVLKQSIGAGESGLELSISGVQSPQNSPSYFTDNVTDTLTFYSTLGGQSSPFYSTGTPYMSVT